MKWVETIVSHLIPTILVDGTPWRALWDQEQRSSFVRSCRLTFPFVGAAYIANHFLFDRAVGLEPIQYWLWFRVGMATCCLGTFLFYLSRYTQSRFYRWPAYALTFFACHSQAWVQIYYGKEAWVFFFIMVLLSCLILRFTSLQAFIWTSIVIGISTPALAASGLDTANIVSGSIVVILAGITLRGGALTDVQLFVSKQEQETAQLQLVELSAEFADRIRSFIPRVIANRLTELMENQRLSVVEASIEALKAKKKHVACLFTDIRGYTQGSKDLDKFIGESVLPEATASSDAIEKLQGIPRKIGDLIFAYFDDDNLELNIARSVLAGLEVARINQSMNATAGVTEIRRYILISSGSAYVGNFGGLDSSIEITALGSPVNYLSRIDELTKAPELARELRRGDLLLDQSTRESLTALGLEFKIDVFDLDQMKLTIRDFPEVKKIYRLSTTDEAYDALLAYLGG